ncbi:MAG: Ppx/GppA phosphatase family protein [Exilibacterium sp.]
MPTSYFVAVDLGSNSFHMLIARENKGSIEVIDRVKDMVQLARGIGRDGKLSEQARQRALACLQCFAERIRRIPRSRVRAVGTKTLRSASDAEQFLKDAEAALGHPIQIISGYEEARLVYVGVAHTITNDHRKRLIIDIGGGSTEFIIGLDYLPQRLESLSIGCVTFTERYLSEGHITWENIHSTGLATCEELELIRADYKAAGWNTVYGTSGTMRVISELMPEAGAGIITKNGLQALIEQTVAAGEVTASGISQLRRDVLPAGMAILHAIFEQFGLEEIHVASATLKEGLIYDSLGRLDHRDTRDQTVESLIARYQIDVQQARRVRQTALKLWSQIKLPKTQKFSYKKLLGWSALLHEIGLSISHSGYHNHGHYLIQNSDLAGFSQFEQQLLGLLIKLHRRKTHSGPIKALEQIDKGLISVLICLRLAILLNRSRGNLDQTPSIRIEDEKVILNFAPAWLQNHPLTERSLEHEADYLVPLGLRLTYSCD